MKKGEIITDCDNPYIVKNTDLLNSRGDVLKTQCTYSLCRCGKSDCSPYCDGSHIDSDFSAERIDKDKPGPEFYEGKEITIVFDRYLCMGAGFCGELEEVFGTHDKPIYNPDGASAEDIIKTIRKCPSGALSYIIDGKHEKNYYSKTEIQVQENGPFYCRGNIEYSDDMDSKRYFPDGDHFCLCRCGKSGKKPLCDGSHHVK